MKKSIYLILACIVLLLSFSSCEKDNSTSRTNENTNRPSGSGVDNPKKSTINYNDENTNRPSGTEIDNPKKQ